MPKIKILLGSLGLFLLLLGGIFFAFPIESLRVLIVILSLGMIASGVGAIIISTVEKQQNFRLLTIILGVVDIVIGILFLSSPELTNLIGSLITIIIGLSILIQGIFVFKDSILAKSQGIRSRGVLLTGAIVLGIIGILMIVFSLGGFILMTKLLGVSCIIAGIHVLILSYNLQKEQLIIIEEDIISIDHDLDN